MACAGTPSHNWDTRRLFATCMIGTRSATTLYLLCCVLMVFYYLVDFQRIKQDIIYHELMIHAKLNCCWPSPCCVMLDSVRFSVPMHSLVECRPPNEPNKALALCLCLCLSLSTDNTMELILNSSEILVKPKISEVFVLDLYNIYTLWVYIVSAFVGRVGWTPNIDRRYLHSIQE